MPFKFGLPSAVRGTRAVVAAPRPAGAAGAWPRSTAGTTTTETTASAPAAISDVRNQFRIERLLWKCSYDVKRDEFLPDSRGTVNVTSRPETTNGTSRASSSRRPVGWRTIRYETLLVFALLVARGVGAGRADEQFLAVFERDIAAVRAVRAVFGLVAFDEDFGARQQRGLGPTAAQQRVRSARFDHPVRDGAVGVLHVEIDPRVWIDPLHLGDRPLQLDRLLRVEFRGEGMVREHRHSGGK